MSFVEFPKIPRLSRDIVITEKIDGTNAQIYFVGKGEINPLSLEDALGCNEYGWLFAGSKSRYLSLEGDNFGFARWVKENAEELMKLGPGRHFGEWWGPGIQRGYGLKEKRFSLFNVKKWKDERPSCCHIVPTLYEGPFDLLEVEEALLRLNAEGSLASPGFMRPEGVVVFHEAAGQVFKATIENDETPKELAA